MLNRNFVNETNYTYFGARYYDSDISIWLSVDPMAQERSWLSPYNYCQLNPVGRIDPTGALDDWYRNEAGEIVYDESIRHQVDFNKSGIKGTYLGKTHQQDNKYYSLFGEIKDLKTTEGKLYQKLDEALSNHAYYINRMSSWRESDNPDEDLMPQERKTNFDIGKKFNKDKFGMSTNNITSFDYYGTQGYYFNYEDKEALIGILDWNNTGKYSSNKHRGELYPFKGGYNVFIRSSKPGSFRSDVNVVMLVFDSQSNKSNFIEKWKKDFVVK